MAKRLMESIMEQTGSARIRLEKAEEFAAAGKWDRAMDEILTAYQLLGRAVGIMATAGGEALCGALRGERAPWVRPEGCCDPE